MNDFTSESLVDQNKNDNQLHGNKIEPEDQDDSAILNANTS